MIYLDYSATTPVAREVLDSFNKVSLEYIGNANSLHKLGTESHDLMEASTSQIAALLGVLKSEVIFTSGASEANNLALIGSVLQYKNRGKHILTTKLEHSSVLDTVLYLKEFGYEVEYINVLENGKLDLDDLVSKIRSDTVLVSISHVNSELGIIQDVNIIGEILKKYPKIIFHVDGTQAVGKIKVNLEDIDLYSFSGHKIYGLKGVGCLIKKKNIELIPIIHGGKSQTKYRSGTPSLALYVSMAKVLKLCLNDFDMKYKHVLDLNKYLKKNLETMNKVHINSTDVSVPHIVNISVLGIKPETMLHALESENIYISTKTACSYDSSMSLSVYEVTKNKDLARSSLRISLSYLTTKDEIDMFLKVFKDKIEELSLELGE
ncbi:MAG: cysteine desulfurase [Bacilli bacterium]|nr:cysteine desulfurase [Bacilli bacterium]